LVVGREEKTRPRKQNQMRKISHQKRGGTRVHENYSLEFFAGTQGPGGLTDNKKRKMIAMPGTQVRQERSTPDRE